MKPIKIGKGDSLVTICHTSYLAKGKLRNQFILIWKELNETFEIEEMRKGFSIFNKAALEANFIHARLRARIMNLKSATWAEFTEFANAKERIQNKNISLGTALGLAELLLEDLTPDEAREIVLAERKRHKARKTLRIDDALEKYLKTPLRAEQSQNARNAYENPVLGIAKRFNIRFVHEFTREIIVEFLTNTKTKDKNFQSRHGCRLHDFFEWLQAMDYFPPGPLPTSNARWLVPRKVRDEAREAPRIYSIAEIKVALTEATDMVRLVLILLIFGNFRPEEAYRFCFEQLFHYWKEGWIWMPHSVAKTCGGVRAERWIPINPFMRRLLRPYLNRTGFFFPGIKAVSDVHQVMAKFHNSIQIEYIKDGYRHSCVSWHEAIGVVPHVEVKWAGNSVEVAKTNYIAPTCNQGYATELASLIIPNQSPARQKRYADAVFARIRKLSITPPASLEPVDHIKVRIPSVPPKRPKTKPVSEN